MSSKTNNRRAPTNGKQEEPTVQSNVLKVSEIEEKERKQRSAGEKIAELIAAFCGSMVFVYVHVVWFGAWIVINSIIPNLAFDPFPYTFLTLVVSKSHGSILDSLDGLGFLLDNDLFCFGL